MLMHKKTCLDLILNNHLTSSNDCSFTVTPLTSRTLSPMLSSSRSGLSSNLEKNINLNPGPLEPEFIPVLSKLP